MSEDWPARFGHFQSSNGSDNPTNDPRPLGGSPNGIMKYPSAEDDAEKSSTNDPRPRGNPAPEVKEKKQNPANEDLIEEQAEEVAAALPAATAALLASATGTAVNIARSTQQNVASAVSTAKETAVEVGKKAVNALSASPAADEDEHKVDEVDLTPEEQFTRHHVELDENKIHHYKHSSDAGTLEAVKKKASHALSTMKQHLPLASSDQSSPTTASGHQITLRSLKYKEPMHMAKVAEGRNRFSEDGRPLSMNKTKASDTFEGTGAGKIAGGAVGSSSSDETADFPETLQEAMKGSSADEPSEENKEVDLTKEEEPSSRDADFNEPEPFGTTVNARSKL